MIPEQASRLRVERLVIVESRSPTKFIRDIRLHAGLNIVWAEELPTAEGTTEVERAGHGVGKSTFSLMLRAVLGDDGAAVKTMRGHLADYYGSGGIAAEVVTGAERFAVFRPFGSPGFALRNCTVEGLFEENAKVDAIDFSTYLTALGERACLQHMPTRTLPITGQDIEWGHVLCWIARDQALGLRQYFEWRNDDGAGLRRRVKDPPALVRLVLGLLREAEAEAEMKISRINNKLSKARETLRSEEQRGTNTRGIVETLLRTWAGVSKPLQMIAGDLFADSVEKEIQRKTRHLESRNGVDRADIAALDIEIVELATEIKERDRFVKLAKARLDETVALRNNDQKGLEETRKLRDNLLTLSGMCQFGRIAYSDCSYVNEQRSVVQLKAQREVVVRKKAIDDWQDREVREKAEYEAEAKVIADLVAARDAKITRKKDLNKALEKRLRELGEGEAVRKTLAQWQESNQGAETEKLRTSRTAVVDLERKLEAAKGAKFSAQQQVTKRERQINASIANLSAAFGVNSRYVPADEKRPFQMLGADGDAYTVLEILLGDLACAEDGAKGGADGTRGAHPGLLIFDCPREREMSQHLYDCFLTLVDEVCHNTPCLQVIITTTTAPPEKFREPPTCVLKLSRASDEDFLLKRRIENLLARATPFLHDTSDEEGS